MSLGEVLRARRQRNARKRYEREKAERQSQNGEAMEKVAEGAKTLGGGLGFSVRIEPRFPTTP